MAPPAKCLHSPLASVRPDESSVAAQSGATLETGVIVTSTRFGPERVFRLILLPAPSAGGTSKVLRAAGGRTTRPIELP